ncbi:MAG: hypothetical protein OIF58_13500, partial [Cohaesibacter sp.]|nr:hypothetical protein [Cohaesibacter sp.]
MQPFGKIIKGRGDRFEIVDSKFNPVPDRASYGELLSLSAERLMSYTAAIDTAFPKDGVVYDLTGGQDSRVCFAAAIGAGVKGLNFFVGGDDGDDDLYVARQLANSFGAKEANFPENYTENFISANEQARRAVFRQQGHSTLYHYALGKGRLDTVARIR